MKTKTIQKMMAFLMVATLALNCYGQATLVNATYCYTQSGPDYSHSGSATCSSDGLCTQNISPVYFLIFDSFTVTFGPYCLLETLGVTTGGVGDAADTYAEDFNGGTVLVDGSMIQKISFVPIGVAYGYEEMDCNSHFDFKWFSQPC